MKVALCITAALLLLFIIATYICFRLTFYSKTKDKNKGFSLPPGPAYEPYREKMHAWAKEIKSIPHEDVSVISFDGLTLRGKLYEYAPGADIELMFPGYRGCAERDLCGGVQRCFSLQRSALIVDQRGGGTSDGHIISFCINEHKDCLTWVDYLTKRFGNTRRVILTGISMGASTVLAACGEELPENVVGVIADCGFTCPKEIIKLVIKQIGLPAELLYPLVRLSGMLYGGFDLESVTSIEQVKKTKLPVFFAHGADDDLVPSYMSQANYDACPTAKLLLSVPKAGHGLAYVVDPEGYVEALRKIEPEYRKL